MAEYPNLGIGSALKKRRQMPLWVRVPPPLQ